MTTIPLKLWDGSGEEGNKLIFEGSVSGSFRIGRQSQSEPPKLDVIHSPTRDSSLSQKLVIATAYDRQYSRSTAEVILLGDDVKFLNKSGKTIRINSRGASSQLVESGGAANTTLPCSIQIDHLLIEVGDGLEVLEPSFNRSLFRLSPTVNVPVINEPFSEAMSLIAPEGETSIENARLLELLQTMLQIFQDSPSHQAFFENAGMAMVQLLELDHVLIGMDEKFANDLELDFAAEFEMGPWKRLTLQVAEGQTSTTWMPSQHVLKRMESDLCTLYEVPEVQSASLMDVDCLVASPLIDSAGKMVGFVYGNRLARGPAKSTLGEAEAKFVELFANAISVGLERLSQERKISSIRATFDQFFSPNLAKRIQEDRGLLAARSATISVLFADIRGFSRISERIGPEKTIAFVNSIMSQLSECVFEFDGVVVDYIGDEILAMWGAPVENSEHATLAVQAGLLMLERIPEINQQWESEIGEPFEIGIGICSGEAQVGNIGSERKFKYGPLGDVVNVASRIQGATRHLGALFLITESTAASLGGQIPVRKLRSVRFKNIERAISVFEVPLRPSEKWMELRGIYEMGLALFESGNAREASQKMAELINMFPADEPSLKLLADSVAALGKTAGEFDSVWTLDSK